MTNNQPLDPVYQGELLYQTAPTQAKGEFVFMNGERFYRIRDFDAIDPFFVSLISSSDHWLFISSTGGLAAGRIDAEHALFPYYTEDKISENSENTGSKAILLVRNQGRQRLWEPLSSRQSGIYRLERSLYKNDSGSTLIFEEINFDLELTYRYAWRTSEQFGFIKTIWLVNGGPGTVEVELVDGLQNLLPANISTQTQNTFSVLLDAYKRSELDPETGLGIFALGSNLTDLAEPSEALQATTVACVGLPEAQVLLSARQLASFRDGASIQPEFDVRGRRAAYLVHTTLRLAAGEICSWHLAAEVKQDHAAIARWRHWLRGNPDDLYGEVETDIALNQANLTRIVSSADGMQLTGAALASSHHFANVLFNVLRGGVFADGHQIQADDLFEFIAVRRPALLQVQADFFARLPQRLEITNLQELADASGSPDLVRLCAEYLPLTFSRRHGDPSRPWNRFSINVKKADGSRRLDYQGNWRDIFQNWEALAWSHPQFVDSMISVFLNATTVDGYNPYRITRAGLDWEQPEPGNPWANIGYWGDHQIIYLQKLMEISARVHPGHLQNDLARPAYSYGDIPYRIKPYSDLLHDPYNTIDFDWQRQDLIEQRVQANGADGRLMHGPDGRILYASLAEKLLTLLLAKMANFVPEGGIWMNTQRPEWNDANNALVGKGLSVVTLGYLRRMLAFCRPLFAGSASSALPVAREVAAFFNQVADILERFLPRLEGSFSDEQRRALMDALGQAGSAYRWNYYKDGLSGERIKLPIGQVVAFLELAQAYIEHTLRANRRPDNLYHAYNILHLANGRATIGHLYEMLEGQVAILSSGLLSPSEALALLESLRRSALYRADQHSYILYPDRDLPGFLKKNRIAPEKTARLALVQALVAANESSLITRDLDGVYHFSGHLRNLKDVDRVMTTLGQRPEYAALIQAEAPAIRALFEDTFCHSEFTGRSGTFFAYEGLGSIYWHMVSKLLLATQEVTLQARLAPDGDHIAQALAARYRDIRLGLSFNKTPQVYGAFPTDPYSHTPKGQGARQPGMTGQVKEEILTRMAELGLFVYDGRLVFDPFLLDQGELLDQPAQFIWLDVHGRQQVLETPAGALAYTFCQVPILVQVLSQESTSGIQGSRLELTLANGTVHTVPSNVMDLVHSMHILQRDGEVQALKVYLTSGLRSTNK